MLSVRGIFKGKTVALRVFGKSEARTCSGISPDKSGRPSILTKNLIGFEEK